MRRMPRLLAISGVAVGLLAHAALPFTADAKSVLNACWAPAELAAKPGEKNPRKGDHSFDAPPAQGRLLAPSAGAPSDAAGAIRRVKLPPGASSWR